MWKSKIIPFDRLTHIIRDIQKQGKKAVLCYGFFGVLHIGHIRYLKKAKDYGNFLVVVITPDSEKDPKSIEQFENMRAEALAYFDWVDAVSIAINGSFCEMIKALAPDIYLKGYESVGSAANNNGNEAFEELFCRELGIEYVVAKEDNFATTDQINRYISNFSENVLNYLSLFKQRYTIDIFLQLFNQIEQLRVLVVGDTILDEYQYCSAIGKSSKDPAIALKYKHTDLFAGGVLAVANHIASFVNRVDLVTVLGEKDSYEEFILSNLKANIDPHYLFKPNAPTLIKKRFIDGYSTNKLFEVYVMDDSLLDTEQDKQLCDFLRDKLPEYDLVVVADYGHGTISPNMIDALTQTASFLAVNTQSNAGNRGFNTITKYPKADYVSLAEHEVRLEMRDPSGKLFPMIHKLAKAMRSRHFIVTRGKTGCMLTDQLGSLFQVPSFTENVVDRVGAGDAFFVLTALFSVLNAPSELLGFIGNVAGSIAVSIMGNKKAIEKNTVAEYVGNLLS